MSEAEAVFAIVAQASAWLIAGIFAAAAWHKFAAQNQVFYQQTIEAYGIQSQTLMPILPRFIACLELSVTLLILIPATKVIGLAVAASILFLYLMAFAKQLLQGKTDMDCGCAGPAAQVKIGPVLLLRNFALVMMCGFAAGFTMPLSSISIVVMALLLAGIFALVYMSVEQLIANGQKIKQINASAWG